MAQWIGRLLVLLPLLWVSGCETLDLSSLGPMGDAFTLKNEDEEKEVGAEAAAVLLGASPVLKDAALQGYVNRVGRWVALHSSRPDLDWKFAVLDDGDVNAFAAPGGYVFITMGMLAQMRSEAELAGVLGHEIAHVTEKHHLKAIRKESQLKAVGALARLALENEGHDSEKYEALMRGAKTIYTRGLDRGDELEADRVGVVLAARAGYDPYGLMAVLQALDRLNPESSALKLMTSTHPKPSDRLAQLDKALVGPIVSQADYQSLDSRFRDQLKHLAR